MSVSFSDHLLVDSTYPPAVIISSLKVPMRWPLRYQILFPFAALFVAVIVLCSALDAYLAARASERQIETQLREIARTLHGSSFPLTDAVLRQTRGLSGAEFVVTDPTGAVTASSLMVETVPAVESPVQRWEQLRLGPSKTVAGSDYFHAALALEQRGDRAEPGLLHIFYPEHVWREARWQAVYPPLLVGAVALLAVGGVAFAISARLEQPIQQLRTQVGQLAKGDFQTISLPTRNDELRDLVESVNTLAGQLEELRRVIKRSERLSLLGQLGAGLAHHLRNDVTGARMAMQLHERECPSHDVETLTVALRQLTLAEQHLQQFLAAGQPRPPLRAPCQLPDLIDELVSLVGPTCQHRHVDLSTTANALEEHSLFADREQLRQALLNLVLNAIEAAAPHGWVRVECQAMSTMNQLEIRICDSGPGVPTAIAERLFEPFTTGKQEGVGLGLTVARQIAEAHEGTLQYSREGATCFTMRLPMRGAAESVTAHGLQSVGLSAVMATQ